MLKRLRFLATASVAIAAPSLAWGSFVGHLDSLNGSGVSADVQIDLTATTLRVRYQATGLEPGRIHPGHIHGKFSNSPVISGQPGAPADSFSPTIANDTDGDGFIEVAEGFATYGNILVPLTNVPNIPNDGGTNFPVADAFGNINYDVTFDLNEPSNFEDPLHPTVPITRNDISPLDFREIVLHGMTVAPGPGANTPGEVNGTNGYLATLPVASGVINVPEPGAMSLAVAAGLLGLRRRRRTPVR